MHKLVYKHNGIMIPLLRTLSNSESVGGPPTGSNSSSLSSASIGRLPPCQRGREGGAEREREREREKGEGKKERVRETERERPYYNGYVYNALQ